MREAVESTERVTGRNRQQLTCRACGAGNAISDRVLDDGFRRCDRCGTAMPVEGAGRYAFEAGGFTLVVSPGRSCFSVRYMRLFSFPGWLLFLLLGEPVSGVLRKVLTGPLAWLPVVVYGILATGMFLLLATRQRILLVNNRIEVAWWLFGLRVFHRRFGTHGLRCTVRHAWPTGLWLRSRAGHRAWIGTDGVGEAESLGKEIEIAVDETRQPVGSERLRCPGCDAPLATPLEVVERRGAQCAHCASGVVAVKGGVVLDACKIDLRLTPGVPPARSRRKRRDGGIEWRVGSDFSRDPTRALGYWSVGLLVGGGMVLAGAGLLLLAEGWRSFGLVFAMVLAPLGLGLLYFFTISFFGRHRVGVDARIVEHDLHLGPLCVRRERVPLARLMAFDGEPSITSFELKLRTPLREVEIGLPDPSGEGAAVAAEMGEAVRDALRALERGISGGSREVPDEERKDASPVS